jgi:hypothetical protein
VNDWGSALAMTNPGDSSMTIRQEGEAVTKGEGARPSAGSL